MKRLIGPSGRSDDPGIGVATKEVDQHLQHGEGAARGRRRQQLAAGEQ